MNTIQLSEESAIIPLKTLNMYKGMEATLAQVLGGEKFFKIVSTEDVFLMPHGPCRRNTEFCISYEWEARYAFEDHIRHLRIKNEELSKKVEKLSIDLQWSQVCEAGLKKQLAAAKRKRWWW